MTIYGPGELMADLDRKDGVMPDKQPVHFRNHVRDGEDSRKNWRKFDRHRTNWDKRVTGWFSKGTRPKLKKQKRESIRNDSLEIH